MTCLSEQTGIISSGKTHFILVPQSLASSQSKYKRQHWASFCTLCRDTIEGRRHFTAEESRPWKHKAFIRLFFLQTWLTFSNEHAWVFGDEAEAGVGFWLLRKEPEESMDPELGDLVTNRASTCQSWGQTGWVVKWAGVPQAILWEWGCVGSGMCQRGERLGGTWTWEKFSSGTLRLPTGEQLPCIWRCIKTFSQEKSLRNLYSRKAAAGNHLTSRSMETQPVPLPVSSHSAMDKSHHGDPPDPITLPGTCLGFRESLRQTLRLQDTRSLPSKTVAEPPTREDVRSRPGDA